MKDISQGFIALFRQFVDWEWYDDANTMRLFIHCLLLANYKDKKWRGKLIKRGSFITSQPKLAHSLKLSIMQIRNSLRKLKSTGEITVQTTPEYSIITVKNYNLYQDDNRLKNRQTTPKEQTSNRRTTTTNNSNKDTNNIYNISLSKEKNKISERERNILKNYVLNLKRKPDNVNAYIRKLIDNGDYLEIIRKEEQKAERKKQKQAGNIPPAENEKEDSPEERAKVLEMVHKKADEIRKSR